MAMNWRRTLLPLSLVLLQLPGPVRAQAPAEAPAASAKTWLEHRQEIEDYIKSAQVVEMEELKVGVTRPRRAKLAPGGPVDYIAWKVVPPGRPAGFWESYKSEIAAYELDKLLGLNMVPPTVERRVKGETGAAIMWCSPTKSFKDLGGVPSVGGKPALPAQHLNSWNRQMARAKMFDNLIGNIDPNLGNWLVDPAWNLILIDHTRAFVTDKNMAHKNMTRVDAELWDRMKALTQESLTAAIGKWVGRGEIKAVLERRDRLQQIIDKLIKEKGEAAVILR
jgi:hypothetical protein